MNDEKNVAGHGGFYVGIPLIIVGMALGATGAVLGGILFVLIGLINKAWAQMAPSPRPASDCPVCYWVNPFLFEGKPWYAAQTDHRVSHIVEKVTASHDTKLP